MGSTSIIFKTVKSIWEATARHFKSDVSNFYTNLAQSRIFRHQDFDLKEVVDSEIPIEAEFSEFLIPNAEELDFKEFGKSSRFNTFPDNKLI